MARTALRLRPTSSASAKLDLQPGATTVAIADIRLRRDGDARPLTAAHVVTLAESIAALGILEPVVIDTAGYLLAGGHRLAALQLLAEPQIMARRRSFLDRVLVDGEAIALSPTTNEPPPGAVADLADRVAQVDAAAFAARYPRARVPVVVVDVSGRDRAAQAIAIEAAENSVRQQYSRDEVRALAAKLQAAGYIRRVGRPRKGEKSAKPVLEALLGCSGRHLDRLLGEDGNRETSEWDRARKALLRAAQRLCDAGRRRSDEDSRRLLALAKQLIESE